MDPRKDTSRMCAHIATAFLLRITFGGSPRDMETATTGKKELQLVVCDVWSPVQMESAQQNTDGTDGR